MNYRSAVAEGKRLVKEEGEAKWRLGDLALEVAPLGPSGTNSGAFATLEEFAGDIGISPESLRQYRTIAAAYPKHRNLAAWSVYVELASFENRLTLIQNPPGRADKDGKKRWTITKAREYRHGKTLPNRGGRTNLTPSERVEQAQELLRDPRVAIGIMNDPIVADRVSTALETAAPRVAAPSRRGRSDVMADALNLVSDLRGMHRTIDNIAIAVADGKAVVSQDMADAILEEVSWLRNALDLIESGVKAGSLDEALAQLIEDAR